MTAPRDGGSGGEWTADPLARPGSPAEAEASQDPDRSAPGLAGQGPAGPAPAAARESPAEEGEERDAAPVEEDFEALLADTKRERDEYLELAKRTKADFENYRRRMSAEVEAASGRGKAQLIREVVPVLDDLERALQAAGLDPEGDSPEGLEHGVLLVFRSLRETLARNGIESLDPQGERFDPNLHEALSTQAADGAKSGTVVEVLQKGYRLEGQLIRPARVVVAE